MTQAFSMRRFAHGCGLAFALFLFVQPAAACSCVMGKPLCDALPTYPWSTSKGALFVGVVTGITDAEFPTSRFARKVRLKVVEKFAGGIGDSVEVFTGRGGGDCGVPFSLGESYLVDAGQPEPGRWTASICSHTRRVDQAKDELATLRAWKDGKTPESYVSGRVVDANPTRATPLLQLELRSATHRHVTTADERGEFRFGNLARERYELRVMNQGWKFEDRFEQKTIVDLTKSVCSEIFLAVEASPGK